jgi:5-methylthioadenosine/S-adenosylhomocysteine deaminase
MPPLVRHTLGMIACLAAPLAAGAAERADPALLVRNATFFTMAPDQKTPFHGYMTVDQDGKIADVGQGDPPASLHAAQTFDAYGAWIMPGFISAHSHLWQAAYRGLAPDQTLTGWLGVLYGQVASRADDGDFYWFTLDGALDHLEHGVTAAYDFNRGNSPYDPPGSPDINRAEFDGELASGIRFVHGIDMPHQPKPSLDVARQHLKSFLDWTARRPRDPHFLSVMINGSTAFVDTPEEATIEATLMREFHVGNQSHYLEPPDLIREEQDKFPWFEKAGLLGPGLIFGHFIHTTPEIIAKTAAAHGAMAWNPLSNGRLASGVADIPAYLKAGIRVGMGEDGEASADLVDPFENMRTGLYAIRDKYQNAAIMSPYDVMRLHTLGSADVIGEKTRLGSLERGKFADFLVIDPSHFAHVFDPYATLVFVASEQDLARVYVGGVQMTDHGRLLHQDMRRVETEVDRRVAASLKKPATAAK